MNLGQLTQLLRGSILNDRTDRVSGSSDYLWEDETLVTFINEAQRRFAVRSLILRDGRTDEATKITLVAGQSTYKLHEAVIAVLSAKRQDVEVDLQRAGHPVLSGYRAPSDTWIDPRCFFGLQPGPAVAYTTDESLNDVDTDSFGQITLRVYPTPAAEQDGEVVRLRVVRKPLQPLVHTGMSATPEIPEDHHIEMLDWAAYLALRIVDDDAGAPKRAAEFAQSFEAHVQAARKLVMSKMFAPVGWAFGRGGYSWDS